MLLQHDPSLQVPEDIMIFIPKESRFCSSSTGSLQPDSERSASFGVIRRNLQTYKRGENHILRTILVNKLA
jgi:hypothetical protein